MGGMEVNWPETLRFCLVCLKVGAFVFGGGMAMIPMMEQDVVYRYGWLTAKQFADAVAIGQMTPGPLLVSVTFIGYKIGGVVGATLATICIFLPSWVMTLALSKAIERFRESPAVQGFLSGVNPAVVGLVLATAVSLGRSCITDPWTALFAVLALLLATKFKVDAVYIVIGAGILGAL
ncbi:MAG TPA: chromate transporter, partial [Armatimonadetes bacterium]|nr:chromate transporter [Armatimonadota bacterium]